jgi:hypothetical protein
VVLISISMASLVVAQLSARHFQAALLGLCKKNFYGKESEINYEDLVSVVYAESGLSPEDALDHLKHSEKLLLKAAKNNWDPTAVEEAATSLGYQQLLVETFSRFWRSERSKV